MPIFAAFIMLFAMSNVGLPGTSGFVGEFMIILAVFKAHMWIGLVAGLTLVIAPAYTLWMIKRAFFGVPSGNVSKAVNGVLSGVKGVKDIDAIETLIFIVLSAPIIFFGVYPKPIISASHETSTAYVQHILKRVQAGSY